MQYFPDNSVARFMTRLENPISLSGNWEVGLFEVQYVRSWYTIGSKEGWFRYDRFDNDGHEVDSLYVPEGYYSSIEEIVEVINNQILKAAGQYGADEYPVFHYMSLKRKVIAFLNFGDIIEFSKPLACLLGLIDHQNPICHLKFDVNVPKQIHWEAKNSCDLNKGLYSLYVYCDILEHVPIGDVKAPLLRVVEACGNFGDTIHKTYERPLYIPLQKKHFDSLEIDIRSDNGQPVPFEYGKSLVTLHFRLSKSPYFLQ